MQELAAVKLVEKRSRFFAHLYTMDELEELGSILKLHRRKYRKANHHCYAAIVNGRELSKDDKEVGHPGRVLLELLKKHHLDSHCLMVSRVFGGIKLGVGGVARAFRAAAEGAISRLEQESRSPESPDP